MSSVLYNYSAATLAGNGIYARHETVGSVASAVAAKVGNCGHPIRH